MPPNTVKDADNPSKAAQPDDWKLAFGVGLSLIAVGLFLVADNTPFPESVARPSMLWYWLGWAGIVLGLVVLVRANRIFWPELATTVIIMLVLLAAFRIPNLLRRDVGAWIPIPSGNLVGGVEFLSPGQAVGLDAVVPNASKTPEVQVSTYGRVVEVRGKESPVVVIEVSPTIAAGLQKALLAEGAKVTYRLLEAMPTATPPATPAEAAPVPGPTHRNPANGTGYLEIEVAKIKPRASTLAAKRADQGSSEARLVIVEKREEVPPGTPAPVTTTYSEKQFCVSVEAFLDANGNIQDAYDTKNTVYVLLSFEIAKLDEIAASLAAAESIWIENQAGCE